MDEIKTVKIKPSHPSQGDHVVINEADFDPAKHELIEDVPAKRKPGRPRKVEQ